MKYWFIKVILLIVIFFSFNIFEGIVANRVFAPYLQHYLFLKKTEKKYIQKETKKIENSLFIEISNNRLHSILHESEDEVIDCEENGNTDCFISAISCRFGEDDDFWSNLLLEGNLPINDTEIVISEELSKRRNIRINDVVSVKSLLDYKNVRISGILMNPYGITDFAKEDAYYIVSIIPTDDYTSKIRGNWYSFSNFKENDSELVSINDSLVQFQEKKLQLCSIILILKLILCVLILFGVQKILTLRQFYNSLLVAGIKKEVIKTRIILFEIIFLVTSLLLSLIFSRQELFILIDLIAALFATTLNFFFLRRKTYGYN